jgi:hypothetical protein
MFCGLAKFLNPVSWRHNTEYYNNLDFFLTYFRVRLALPSTLNNNSHIICLKAIQCTFICKRNGATTLSPGTQTFLRFWQLYFSLGLKADHLCSYTKHTARLKNILQGGSSMTGTNCDLFTHKSSRSYLNHLVLQLSGPRPTSQSRTWRNINLFYLILWITSKWSLSFKPWRCTKDLRWVINISTGHDTWWASSSSRISPPPQKKVFQLPLD